MLEFPFLSSLFLIIYFGCGGSPRYTKGLSLVVSSGAYSLVAMNRLLIVVASFVAEHGL